MKIRLTKFSSYEELRALLSESLADCNDLVTVDAESGANGLKHDHGRYINPYLKCNPLRPVDSNVGALDPSHPWAETTALQTKQCARCGQPKALGEFYRRRASADGLQAYCKECHKRQAVEWRADNPEGWQQIAARSRARH